MIALIEFQLFLIAPHFAQEVMNLVVRECVGKINAKFRSVKNTNAFEEIQVRISNMEIESDWKLILYLDCDRPEGFQTFSSGVSEERGTVRNFLISSTIWVIT